MPDSSAPAQVYLSLGSNIDREHNLRSGLKALRDRFGALQLSPVYESEAVGFSGSPFLNMVVGLQTSCSVGELAAALKAIEADHGRRRGEKKFASRTLDIDILTYNQCVGVIDGIQLPRDEIEKYAFVLLPLADLAPQAIHPERQINYLELAQVTDLGGQVLWPIPFAENDQ